MEFYAAISESPGAISWKFERLEKEYGSVKPLENVIFTPISQSENSKAKIREMKERYDINVMFDSGGYEVQVGNLSFDDLYSYLLEFYSENQWGDRYVLPDNVPTAEDSKKDVLQKVRETVSATRTLHSRLPENVKEKSVAVVQGHEKRHIKHCIDNYSRLSNKGSLGFGSFQTAGKKNGVNMVNDNVIDNIRFLNEIVENRPEESIHAFGVGGPTSIPLIHELGFNTFDSSSWLKSAAYGNVFFPFRSRLNVTHKKSRSGKVLKREDLERIKEETNHRCPFCRSIKSLQNRENRILHNLIVTKEVAERVDELSQEFILNRMNQKSTYYKLYQRI